MKIIEKVAELAATDPGRIFHESGGVSSTYGELALRSDAVAAYVAQAGGPRQRPVVVIGHKESEMIHAFLGCWKAGNPYVPVESSLPAKRIETIVGHLDEPLVLTPEKVAALPAGICQARSISGEETAYIIFTSGSTGEPKGVPIQVRSLEFFLDWMLREQKLHDREVFLNQAPFCFDLSVMDLCCCLQSGGRLVSITKELLSDAAARSAFLERSKITTWVSTPSFARLCAGDPDFSGERLPELRRFLFCGETLPPALASILLERFPRAEVWNTYGPTEATVATSSVRITLAWIARGGALPVGAPTPGTRISLVDERLEEIPGGGQGEIVISGPNVSSGYLRPREQEQPFLNLRGAWSYRTGDLGHFDQGQLYFDGRMDSQIKLNGYRIELGDLEANLRSLDNVRDAVVITNSKDGEVTALTACILSDSDSSENATARILGLRNALRKRLPDYMVPRYYRFLTEFPMTINGKIDRKELVRLAQ